jgi:hypothetical protein
MWYRFFIFITGSGRKINLKVTRTTDKKQIVGSVTKAHTFRL